MWKGLDCMVHFDAERRKLGTGCYEKPQQACLDWFAQLATLKQYKLGVNDTKMSILCGNASEPS